MDTPLKMAVSGRGIQRHMAYKPGSLRVAGQIANDGALRIIGIVWYVRLNSNWIHME
jgi:hypothetical protein